MERKNILVFGSLVMDFVSVLEEFPTPGETVPGVKFFKNPGGKGANQSVACARLGSTVDMIGQVGRDVFGDELISSLESENIDVNHIQILEDDSSGVASIYVDKHGENTIVVTYGANFAPLTLDKDDLEETFSKSGILLLQNEVDIDSNYELAQAAKDRNLTVIWDPAPPREGAEKIASYSDFITPNQIEASVLAGIRITSLEDAYLACENLAGQYGAIPIITLGSLGVVYSSDTEIIHVPAIPTTAIDTVAAGDSFTGGFAVAISNGYTLHEAVNFAVSCSSISVSREGAQSSMPYLKDLDRFHDI